MNAAVPVVSVMSAVGLVPAALQGFDIDLGNALCAQLKAKCVWVENAFDGLIPALQARKFDAIDSAMNINAKRSEQIDFTQPLYRTPAQLVARTGSPLQPMAASLAWLLLMVMVVLPICLRTAMRVRHKPPTTATR